MNIPDISENGLSLFILFLSLFSSVQSLSCVSFRPHETAQQAFLSITNSQSSLKLMSIELVMPFSHLILCCSLLFLHPFPPSIRVFSNESILCMRRPKYWSFSFKISPSNEHPGLISFRKDWLNLLAVQGNLKSLLQHHSSRASILQCSAFSSIKWTTTIALTSWYCLFNLYAEYVIKLLGWMNHKLESRLPREISTTSDMQMIPP